MIGLRLEGGIEAQRSTFPFHLRYPKTMRVCFEKNSTTVKIRDAWTMEPVKILMILKKVNFSLVFIIARIVIGYLVIYLL